jgi:pyruvate dehydrogenase E1 component beta subunit
MVALMQIRPMAAAAPAPRWLATAAAGPVDQSKPVPVREALCMAMEEEMRADPTVVLIGEEVAQYNGAYKA